MTARQGLAFVRKHGVVLEAARGPVPSVVEEITGETIRGNWWSHPRSQEIFVVTRAIRDNGDVLVCRAVEGKVSFVHRRLWPALVRLAARFPAGHLAKIEEAHTASGAHEMHEVPFPEWVPADVRAAAERLTEDDARAALGGWAAGRAER
jgi:hypothetical protein